MPNRPFRFGMSFAIQRSNNLRFLFPTGNESRGIPIPVSSEQTPRQTGPGISESWKTTP